MILLEMNAAPNGIDPRVWIDGGEVTDRVASVELLPLGMACVRLFLKAEDAAGQPRLLPLPRQIVQKKYQIVTPKVSL